MTCRKAQEKTGSSGVQVPSRPSSIDTKLDEIIGFVVGAFTVVGVLLILIGVLFLFGNKPATGTITGMIGVFMVYYAH